MTTAEQIQMLADRAEISDVVHRYGVLSDPEIAACAPSLPRGVTRAGIGG